MKEDNHYHLPIGTILKEQYKIEEVLGSGGFGITYRGTNTKIGLRIAIKEYFPYGCVSRDASVSDNTLPKADEKSRQIYAHGKERFLEEAQKMAMCDHIASIVRVYDFFEANQTAYIVMEYLDGITLENYLKINGPMEPEWICKIMLPLLRDLNKVHALGLLHRDISPDNIMLVGGKHLQLIDFGAARRFDVQDWNLTVMLKHGFAPLEQYSRSGKQGEWTDVYALGATIYACLTGTKPEAAPDRLETDILKLIRQFRRT